MAIIHNRNHKHRLTANHNSRNGQSHHRSDVLLPASSFQLPASGTRCNSRYSRRNYDFPIPNSEFWILNSCTWPLLAFLLLCAPPASAVQWKLEPEVRARTTHSTNLFMTTQPHDAVTEVLLAPKLKGGAHGELWDATATGRLEFSRYPGEDGLGSNDRFLDLNFERRLERGKLNLDAGLSRDTTNRVESFDLDTGLITRQIDRNRRNLSVSGEYSLSERWLASASLAYQSASYPDGAALGLTDYTWTQPTVSLFYRWNEQWQLFGSLAHSRLNFDNSVNTVSKTNSAQLGVQYQWSERDTFQFSIGRRTTRASFDVFFLGFIPLGRTTNSDKGLVYNGRYTRKYETGELDLSLSRSTSPSSLGVDTDTTSLNLKARKRFSPLVTGELAVSVYSSSTIGSNSTSADYDRWQVSPTLYWRLTERWALNARYTYRRVKRDVGNATATGNVYTVGLVYRWDPIEVAR